MLKSKNRYFYHIFVSPGDGPGAITLSVVWMERKFDAYKLSRSMCPSIFNSFPVIRTASAKIAIFTYRSPRFCFPWRRPCDYHAICCMDGKTIQCLPNPSLHVPIYIQHFPSYTMLKSMRKSKNCYFYHILLSHWDAPGAFTLTVVWMEREFSACQTLVACTHLSSTVFQLFEPQVQKIAVFHVPQPTFLFPLVTPLRLSRNMLHGWKDNSMLAKPIAACTYLYAILSELYDA